MRKVIPVLAGIVVGAILTTGFAAFAQWNDRGRGGPRPDSDVLDRIARAEEEIARSLAQSARSHGEAARALAESARAQSEMARALGDLRSRCK
jgi:hypothetical protein